MATSKTWTAEDIRMGVMRLHYKDGDLSLMQGYVFIDNLGDKIEELPGKSVMETQVFSTLPTEIQTSLTTLNTYMYNKALVNENME